MQRLSRQCFPRSIIDHVIESTDYFMPYRDWNTTARKDNLLKAYCVLPYHSVWLCLRKDIQICCDNPHHKDMLEIAFNHAHVPTIAVSWKQMSPPFGVSLVKW